VRNKNNLKLRFVWNSKLPFFTTLLWLLYWMNSKNHYASRSKLTPSKPDSRVDFWTLYTGLCSHGHVFAIPGELAVQLLDSKLKNSAILFLTDLKFSGKMHVYMQSTINFYYNKPSVKKLAMFYKTYCTLLCRMKSCNLHIQCETSYDSSCPIDVKFSGLMHESMKKICVYFRCKKWVQKC